MAKNVKKKRTAAAQNHRSIYMIAAVVVALLVVGLLLYWHHHSQKAVVLTTSQKGETSTTDNAKSPDVYNPTPDVPGGSTGGTNGTPPSTNLPAPSGTFISAHHVTLSSAPLLNSTCNTVVGATCEIQFSKDGVTKSLTAKASDKDGTVSWDWKLQDIGLTQGTWQIEAIATLNGQIQTAQDTLNLEVQP